MGRRLRTQISPHLSAVCRLIYCMVDLRHRVYLVHERMDRMDFFEWFIFISADWILVRTLWQRMETMGIDGSQPFIPTGLFWHYFIKTKRGINSKLPLESATGKLVAGYKGSLCFINIR